MAISEFQANEFVTRNNVNSRISAINDLFPVSIANGGTGGATKAGALTNLGVIDTIDHDFTANDQAAYIAAVQNYFSSNYTDYIPYVFNAGWSGQGYGVAIGVKSAETGQNKTLIIINEKAGMHIYHKDNGINDWKDISPAGIVLYENSSGTKNTVTLSETAANFASMKIFYAHNDGECNIVEIYSPNGKSALLSQYKFRNDNVSYATSSKISISGTSITWTTDNGYNRLKTNPEITANNGAFMAILKVIGYRY